MLFRSEKSNLRYFWSNNFVTSELHWKIGVVLSFSDILNKTAAEISSATKADARSTAAQAVSKKPPPLPAVDSRFESGMEDEQVVARWLSTL